MFVGKFIQVLTGQEYESHLYSSTKKRPADLKNQIDMATELFWSDKCMVVHMYSGPSLYLAIIIISWMFHKNNVAV